MPEPAHQLVGPTPPRESLARRLRKRWQMRRTREPRNLQELLDCLDSAGCDKEEVSLEEMLDAVGRRSFGPLLLLCGVIVLSPLSGIVGLPSLIALMVILLAGQLLLRRKQFWLPEWLLQRKMGRTLVSRALRMLQPVARFTDSFIHPRLQILTGSTSMQLIAAMCALVAMTMPLMEIVPFANTAAGVALTTFGLALIARDGVLVLLGSGMFAGAAAALLTLL